MERTGGRGDVPRGSEEEAVAEEGGVRSFEE